MKKKWEGQTRGGLFGYLFFVYLIRIFGVRFAYLFLGLVVIYFIPFAPEATRSIWKYAREICKYNIPKSVRLLFSNYYRLGQILIDKVALGMGKSNEYHFEFENYDEFLSVLNQDTGVVMIGAHVGYWEIGAPFFDKYGKKINIVMFDNEHQRIKRVLERHSQAQDFKIIPVNKDSLAHVFAITKALSEHEYVCFQGDRFVRDEKLLESSLLGKNAKFPLGPFLLASKMKTPVVFYFAMREPKRTYRFKFFVLDGLESVKGVRPEQSLLNAYTKALDEVLKTYPEQWFNYYDFWK
ncbi:hypothetical protein [Bacteroides propionicifaciens]|uniref:LpxL/LpxP family acyltransferase n=1 Tax=Bacteroides propionicifaciens TaxID=392838 RepID=UPI00036CEFC4|nr:hypothetical protein [Bacteroides propionicifaciens]